MALVPRSSILLVRVFAWLAVPVSSIALLLGCAAERSPEVRSPEVHMDGRAVSTLAAAQVAQAVSVNRSDDRIIYRAPLLSSTREVDLRRGGPVLGSNLGEVSLGQSSFLYGVRTHGSTAVQHFAVYGSDLIEGKNRFASVTLADGSRPSFRTVASDRRGCEPNCYATSEALVIALPDAVLRSVPEAGLPVAITLDNGRRIDVTIPAAYVRGYLQAVDASGG
jgi:hypothetical protein